MKQRGLDDAKATVRTAVLSAMASSSLETRLVMGPASDALLKAILDELESPAIAWALRVIGQRTEPK